MVLLCDFRAGNTFLDLRKVKKTDKVITMWLDDPNSLPVYQNNPSYKIEKQAEHRDPSNS